MPFENVHGNGGFQLRDYKGIPVVEHSGSTAGYRGHLARFPEQGLAVAVTCYASTASAGGLLKQVADLYLGDAVSDSEPPATGTVEMPRARRRPRSSSGGTPPEQ